MNVRHTTLKLALEGAELHAEAWLPSRPARVPTLLMRTPYGATDAQQGLYAHPSFYAEHGYAVVVQDVRGRWSSGGEFEPFRHEAADGAATVEWLIRQPWSDGRVGTYGMSYPGATQILTASRRPPGLRAVAPAMTASDLWDGWFYDHGVLNLSLVPYWAAILALDSARRAGDLPALTELQELCARPQELYDRYDTAAPERLLGDAGSRHAPYLAQWLEHRTRDEYWDQLTPPNMPEQIAVPALHIAGWFDVFLTATLDSYQRLQAVGRAPQHLVIAPWAHEPWSPIVGDRDLGERAANRIDELQLQWFGHWLRDAELGLAPVTVFVLGPNTWREEQSWPPASVRFERLHLRSDARANSLGGDGRLTQAPPGAEPHDRFLHNPRAPVASIGGRGCSITNGTIVGPRDQRGQAARNDVLVYDTAPAQGAVLLAGQARCDVYVSLPRLSADYVIRLVHVAVDGSTFSITDAVARLSAAGRTSSPAVESATAGRGVVRLRMALGHCCVALRPGERIRLEVCGSSFPRWERNWNGHPPFRVPLALGESMGTQCVFHDGRFPSAILLPVIEGHL